MFPLCPHCVFDDYRAVTPEFLRARGIRLLLSDLDFTLAPKSVADAPPEVRDWIAALHAAGITLVILSNNRSTRRVERFCAPLGVPYVGRAQKPLRRGYEDAMRRHAATPRQTAMLGDKLLTDCLGARRCGLLTLAVEPLGGARSLWQQILHALQEPFKRRGGDDQRRVKKIFGKV